MSTSTEAFVDKLASWLAIEHSVALGLTGLRHDIWSLRMAEHRRMTPKCSVCLLLKEVGYYDDE